MERLVDKLFFRTLMMLKFVKQKNLDMSDDEDSFDQHQSCKWILKATGRDSFSWLWIMDQLGCLIMILLLNRANGLLCFENGSFSISSSTFSFNRLEEIFAQEKLTEKLYCGATIAWNSVSNEISIQFSAEAFEISALGLRNIHVHMRLFLQTGTSENRSNDHSIKNEIRFLCYNRDRCDYFLLLENYEQMVLFNYTSLINTLRSLNPGPFDRKSKLRRVFFDCIPSNLFTDRLFRGMFRWEKSSAWQLWRSRMFLELFQ